MKKLIFLNTVCLLLTALVACSNDGDSPATLPQPAPETHTESTNFLTDWENEQFLYINDNHTLDVKIEAPWNTVSAPTRIPESIRFDVKKADGWEVAFNLMNKDGRPDANYFGLYNKYTGVLRIFYYYNKEVASTATDFAFDIILGVDGVKNPAYYNALNYGIPMNTDVKTNVNLLGEGGDSTTFHLLITPYSCINQNTMIQGWYAFDVDMSAYTGKSFATDGSGIQIGCRAGNKTNVSLGTDIAGKLGGDIDLKTMQASSNGLGKLFSSESFATASGAFGGIASALDETGKAMSKDASVFYAISAGIQWISSICNITSLFTKKTEQPKMSGKIDLTLNATANTKGYLTTELSTNVKQLIIEKAAFNPESNIGKGVWNIDKSPEIYFISDKVICSDPDARYVDLSKRAIFFNYSKTTYFFEGVNSRIPYFYDPSSFSVSINRDVFPDATNMQVLSYCGIYERDGNKTENTAFREALGIGNLHTDGIPIPDSLVKTPDGLFKELLRNYYYFETEKFYVGKSKEEYAKADLKFSGLSYKSYGETADFHYYGQELGSGNSLSFIMEPQIFYAEEKSNTLGQWVKVPTRLPELYVVVIVHFESGGDKYIYSRTFLPKVSEVKYEDAKTIVAGIKTRLDQQTDKVYRDEYKASLDKKMEFLKVE